MTDRLRALDDWLRGVRRTAGPPTSIRLVVAGSAPTDALLTTADRYSVSVRPLDTSTIYSVEAGGSLGIGLVDAEVDSGTDLLALAAPDEDDLVAGLAVIALMTGREPVAVVGYGHDLSIEDWTRRIERVRDRMRAVRDARGDTNALIAGVGSAALATVTGILRQAVVRETPVVLDGPVVTAAALVVQAEVPDAARWWLSAHATSVPGDRHALKSLGLEPLLDLGTSRADGIAALLALPILLAAVDGSSEPANTETDPAEDEPAGVPADDVESV